MLSHHALANPQTHAQVTPPSRYLYIKNHVVAPNNKTVYRLVPLKHVQWIEYDPEDNKMSIQMVGKPDPDVYVSPPNVTQIDPYAVKRTFLNVLRELRSDGDIIEGW